MTGKFLNSETGREYDQDTVAQARVKSSQASAPGLPQSTFLYDVMYLSETDIAEAWQRNPIVISIMASLLIAMLAVTVVGKRRSARPGGVLYRFNRKKINEIRAKRKRRVHAFMNDPFLLRDMERSLQIAHDNDEGAAKAEIDKLRRTAADWEREGFGDNAKDVTYVKFKGVVVVPWVRQMNLGLVFSSLPAMYFPMNILTITWWSFMLLHVVDNSMILRSMKGREFPKTTNVTRKSVYSYEGAVEIHGSDVDLGEPVLASEDSTRDNYS